MLAIPFSHSLLNKCMTIKMKSQCARDTLGWRINSVPSIPEGKVHLESRHPGPGQASAAGWFWVTGLTVEETGLIPGPHPTPTAITCLPPGVRDTSGFIATAPGSCCNETVVLFFAEIMHFGAICLVSHPPVVGVTVEIMLWQIMNISSERGARPALSPRCAGGEAIAA